MKVNIGLNLISLISSNTSFNEYYPFILADGTLYWTSETKRNDPKPKLFRSVNVNGFYSEPEQITHFPDTALVTEITTDFALMTIPDGARNYDLYVCFKESNGTWSMPINLGPDVNSDSMEKDVRLSPDGKYIFFVSGRHGDDVQPQKKWTSSLFKDMEEIYRADIYWVDAKIIDNIKKEHFK